MKNENDLCVCERLLAWEGTGQRGERREVQCACGRLYDFEFRETGWTPASGPMTPEARQPLAGFSLDLKTSEDCRRYYFTYSIAGRRLPVHILFSPSAMQAEVKTGDRKAFKIAPVRSVTEARRRWIERFEALPGRAGSRPRHATRRGIFPAL